MWFVLTFYFFCVSSLIAHFLAFIFETFLLDQQYIWRNFLWSVSSPGPFDCRSNAYHLRYGGSTQLFSQNLFTPHVATDKPGTIFWFFQIISIDYVDHSKSVSLSVTTELYYIDLIKLWFRINLMLFKTRY